MKALAKFVWMRLLILPLCTSVAFAQTSPSAGQGYVYTQAELDQMLAPIALYPDPLLSQILMAATYPLEVVEAARWSKANPHLTGEAAVRAVDDRDWDPSVKSLVAFPRVLAEMDAKLDWTERLGDAFLAQQAEVMNTIQSLRERAYAAGNLQSDEYQRVEQQDDTIFIEPSDPAVVYVPYYNPLIVYGTWWWPGYPPVYWAPWPGYYVGPVVGLTWGLGIVVGTNFFFGTWDWHRHDIRIVDAHPFYYHRVDHRPLPPERVWRHSPEHRRGVPYRNPTVRERFRRSIGSPEQRREFRGFVPTAPVPRPAPTPRQTPAPRTPAPAQPHRRPTPESRAAPQERRTAPPTSGVERLRPNTPMVRPAPPRPRVSAPAIRRVPEQRPNAFEGLGRGQDVRRYSERGRESVRSRSEIRRTAPARPPQGRTAAPPAGSRDRDDGYRRRR